MTTTAPETTRTTDTTADGLEQVVAAATRAAGPLAALPLAARAALLEALADALERRTDAVVEVAGEESHLPEARLRGEVGRTTGQLRLFAAAVREGSFLEATIDTADPATVPPRPDLRRVLVPLGPTLVFAASNFPFAFSVLGGDTASALAAGCPVVVKAHPGHPRLSALVGALAVEALVDAGAPAGTLAVVHGLEAGLRALRHPAVRAAAFTGSTGAGRMLFDVAAARPEPIPFYGELGSTNPVFVTRAAVASRGERIAAEHAASFTLGVGQFCTKPGVLLLPRGHGLEQALVDAVRDVAGAPMLNDGLQAGYLRGLEALLSADAVRVLHHAEAEGARVGPTLLATSLTEVARRPEFLEECFGPVSLVVEYEDEAELADFAAGLPGQLTATVHAEPQEHEALRALCDVLADRAGRVLFGGWPTGVAVTAAMHHGGPYPATTSSLHTSVGTTAVRRFQRPVCYQDAPGPVLPEALRDDNPAGVPRRVDGRLTRDALT